MREGGNDYGRAVAVLDPGGTFARPTKAEVRQMKGNTTQAVEVRMGTLNAELARLVSCAVARPEVIPAALRRRHRNAPRGASLLPAAGSAAEAVGVHT